MDKNVINYRALLNEAMHSVIRETLRSVKGDVAPGEHFFYISFLTDFKNVKISDILKKQYPEQMTIVLQYQFKNLIVEEDRFNVTLCFNHKEERISVPYKSILRFADPSVNIELHFIPIRDEAKYGDKEEEIIGVKMKNSTNDSVTVKQVNNVISLDKFRKKTMRRT